MNFEMNHRNNKRLHVAAYRMTDWILHMTVLTIAMAIFLINVT